MEVVEVPMSHENVVEYGLAPLYSSGILFYHFFPSSTCNCFKLIRDIPPLDQSLIGRISHAQGEVGQPRRCPA